MQPNEGNSQTGFTNLPAREVTLRKKHVVQLLKICIFNNFIELTNIMGKLKEKAMTDFATYYRNKFIQDINQFFFTIPDQSRFHEDSQNKQTFSIQYERLTRDFNHLNFLTKSDKEFFGVALFFTVLTDMVCYSHYRQYYEKFRQLTRYPKFIGNCPGGCNFHFHPRDIFAAMNYSRTKQLDIHSPEQLNFFEKFNEAIKTMKIETINFINEHIKEIDSIQFWETCIREFPYRTNEK